MRRWKDGIPDLKQFSAKHAPCLVIQTANGWSLATLSQHQCFSARNVEMVTQSPWVAGRGTIAGFRSGRMQHQFLSQALLAHALTSTGGSLVPRVPMPSGPQSFFRQLWPALNVWAGWPSLMGSEKSPSCVHSHPSILLLPLFNS